MEESLVDLGSSSNEGDDSEEKPSGERWPPLGAAAVEEENPRFPDLDYTVQQNEAERLKDLEEQQELLNSSLIALTTHFAQVQFRLRQIVDAPPQDKEILLKDLEEFAFRGIPEIPDVGCHTVFHQDGKEFEAAITAQRKKQKELISQLKSQLEELEHYAYEMGEAGLPQSVVMEKQKVIIDELKDKLNLNVDNIDRLTLDDIRYQVDNAISQLVNPLKMKEQLVIQLKTQIVDLERFIDFLQGEGGDCWMACGENESGGGKKKCECPCPVHSDRSADSEIRHDGKFDKTGRSRFQNVSRAGSKKSEETKERTVNMIRRAAALLQIFALSQFGCGGASAIRINSLKKSSKIHHWGDLRARLELAVVNVLTLASEQESRQSFQQHEYSSDSESVTTTCSDAKTTAAVRKQLATSIRDLVQHGLVSMGPGNSTSLAAVPFIGGCFPAIGTSKDRSEDMHAWELILRYYELKNGPRFNSTPNMLGAIGNIVTLHTRFKRSYDAQFKAFVCSALNCQKLVAWLRLVFRCRPLVETYYEPWSYVAKTGFEDSLQSLDKLTHIKFDLPVDIAVHQFQNIKDAF